MRIVSLIFVSLVAIEHLWFLVLEMFLFRTPTGLNTFQISQQTADACAVMAQNQGLYNGFLAAGLITALAARSRIMRRFMLSCVIVAGIFGALSLGNKSVFILQSLPAVLALVLSEIAARSTTRPATR